MYFSILHPQLSTRLFSRPSARPPRPLEFKFAHFLADRTKHHLISVIRIFGIKAKSGASQSHFILIAIRIAKLGRQREQEARHLFRPSIRAARGTIDVASPVNGTVSVSCTSGGLPQKRRPARLEVSIVCSLAAGSIAAPPDSRPPSFPSMPSRRRCLRGVAVHRSLPRRV